MQSLQLSEPMQRLSDSLSEVPYNGAQHSQIRIHESNQEARLRSVTLKVGNGDWICFHPDVLCKCARLEQGSKLVLMSLLLKVGSEHKHHRACDAVVAMC